MPDGYPENPKRCIAEVGRGYHFRQCSRSRGYGEGGAYCNGHANMIAKGHHVWVPKEDA